LARTLADQQLILVFFAPDAVPFEEGVQHCRDLFGGIVRFLTLAAVYCRLHTLEARFDLLLRSRQRRRSTWKPQPAWAKTSRVISARA
jgi:hypothetical protein